MSFKINDRVQCPVGIRDFINGTVVDIEGDIVWVNFDDDCGRADFNASELTYIDVPLSFNQWCEQSNVEDKYNNFHDEYGDAACLLSDYKQYHYDQYLSNFKKYGKYTTLLY